MCSSDLGGYSANGYCLSPGHYLEMIAAYASDTSGGSTPVPMRAVGVQGVLSVNYASSPYNTFALQAQSIGTVAATSGYRVDGLFLKGVDLSGMSTGSGVDMVMRNGWTINATSSNLTFGSGGSPLLSLSTAGSLNAPNLNAEIGRAHV